MRYQGVNGTRASRTAVPRQADSSAYSTVRSSRMCCMYCPGVQCTAVLERRVTKPEPPGIDPLSKCTGKGRRILFWGGRQAGFLGFYPNSGVSILIS